MSTNYNGVSKLFREPVSFSNKNSVGNTYLNINYNRTSAAPEVDPYRNYLGQINAMRRYDPDAMQMEMRKLVLFKSKLEHPEFCNMVKRDIQDDLDKTESLLATLKSTPQKNRGNTLKYFDKLQAYKRIIDVRKEELKDPDICNKYATQLKGAISTLEEILKNAGTVKKINKSKLKVEKLYTNGERDANKQELINSVGLIPKYEKIITKYRNYIEQNPSNNKKDIYQAQLKGLELKLEILKGQRNKYEIIQEELRKEEAQNEKHRPDGGSRKSRRTRRARKTRRLVRK